MKAVEPLPSPPHIDLAPFTVALLTDGLWRNDGGCMFGVVPRELWQRNHPPDDRNRVRLNLTCVLILKGSDAILVDTGIGNRLSASEREVFSHGEGWLLDHLRALGMEPGDVTHVVLSHLHFDHCGGVVRRRPSGVFEPAFPRARHFIQRGELDHASNSSNERQRAAYRHVAECIAPIRPLLEINAGSLAIIPGVDTVVTGGHTFDHQIVLVRGERECLAHLADIVPTRSHMRSAWNQSYDLDALKTMEQKAAYLSHATAQRWWVSFAHDDQVFATRIRDDGGRLSLEDPIAVASEWNSQ